MNFKKIIANTLAALAVAAITTAGFSAPASVEAADAVESPAAVEVEAPKNTYKYVSERYGYSMMLPKKPVGIIPASVAMEGEKGEIIVFENDGYTLKNAWVVTIDAFSDKALPLGIEDGSDQERQEFFDKFAAMGGFEVVKFAELDGKTGVYCVTAMELDVDTDGDGIDDETVTADSQMIKTYFRGEFGGHFCVAVLNNPYLTPETVNQYEQGLLSFHQWPTPQNVEE